MVYHVVVVQSHLRRKLAPFRVGQSLSPYPSNYYRAFAFSSILYLHLHSPPSRETDSTSLSIALTGEKYRFTTFRMIYK